jgi:hypothetical protein
VLVLARTVVADGEPHSLALTVNGDSITTWSVDSDTSRAYRTFVFSRPGPSVFELRGDKVYVERITVIQGHRASALAPVDPATAQSRLVSVPMRVVGAAPE